MKTILADWRTWLFGLLSWLLPFIAAFPFFNAAGELQIAQPLFKSLMVVIGATVGVALLVPLIRRHGATLANGLVIGLIWLALNWALDLIVLVPMSGDTFGGYFADIGLRYLVLPVIAAGMGAAGRKS